MLTVIRVCVVVVGVIGVVSYTSSQFPSWNATYGTAYPALPLGIMSGNK